MNRHSICRLLVSFLAVWLNLHCLFPQERVTAESEYLRIRSLAINGDLQNSALQARRLVNEYPGYGDARILLARITAWQKNYKMAYCILDTLLSKEPGNADALSLKKDIDKWSETPPVLSPTAVVAGYSFDTFTEPFKRFWQVYKAGAIHNFKWGKGAAAMNVGNIVSGNEVRVRATEFQAEAEAYPKISEKNYAYLAYAFSPGDYFPEHRAAAELWQVLPHSWAVSAGLSYYYFTRNIFIAGASAEKYAGNYWFSAKAFVYFKDNGPTTSGYLNARRYFNDNDYLQVTIGTGTAPDEPYDIQADIMRLSATSVRLSYYKKLKNEMTFRIGAGYSSEEYAEASWRNRFEGNVTVSYPIMKK